MRRQGMSVIQRIGNGYFGVETQGENVNPEVFKRISKVYERIAQRSFANFSLVVTEEPKPVLPNEKIHPVNLAKTLDGVPYVGVGAKK